MREDVVLVKRDGGIGKDKARLKRWITVCKDDRTWRRVRRWGRALGSFLDASGIGEGCNNFLAVLGDAGRLPCLVRVGDEGTVWGEDAVSKPSGTNPRIASSSRPLEDNESASDRASPRSSSTS